MTLRGWIFWAAVLGLMAQAAAAWPPGWYRGWILGPAPEAMANEAPASARTIFGDYRFRGGLAAEAGYVGLGSLAVRRSAAGRAGSNGVAPEAFCMSGVGSMSVSRNFWLLGRAGLCRWDGRYPTRAGLDGLAVPDHGIAGAGAAVTYGLGGGYRLTPALGMRMDWQRYAGAVRGVMSLDRFSFGLSYRFQ